MKGNHVTRISITTALSLWRQLHICLILPHLSSQSTVESSQRLLLISHPLSDRATSVLGWSGGWSGSGCGSQSLRSPCATFKPFPGEKIKKQTKNHKICIILSAVSRSILASLCLLWLQTCALVLAFTFLCSGSSHPTMWLTQDLLFQPLRHLVPAQSLSLILSGSEGSVLGDVIVDCAAFVSVFSPSCCRNKVGAAVGPHFIWKPQLLQLHCGPHKALPFPPWVLSQFLSHHTVYPTWWTAPQWTLNCFYREQILSQM